MPTRTTSKTAARKPATARKTVKAAAAATKTAPKRKDAKHTKVEAPAKSSRTLLPATPTKSRAVAHPAPKPRPVVKSVSLIEEKKPRTKRVDGDAATKRPFLPPITRIHAKSEAACCAREQTDPDGESGTAAGQICRDFAAGRDGPFH